MSGVQIPIDRRRFNNGVIALLWKQTRRDVDRGSIMLTVEG
tara:strand:+ start:2734 stop:2856 length:123 start_codon:yes stop_codon:yes gene_type:complete